MPEALRQRRAASAAIRFRTTFHNTIYDVLKARNWKETDSDTDWDFAWVDTSFIRENVDSVHLDEHQRVNHFRNFYELTRKDCMMKNLKRMQRLLQREQRLEEARKYDFFPSTYVLPVDYGIFVEEFKQTLGAIWIMKPIGKAQGKGIFLFNKLSQVNDWKRDHRWKPDNEQAETYVVQRYIHNPLLVGGKKFDLRIYVLVTSYQPLVVYIYRSGFSRFTASRYNTNTENLRDNYLHLTNVAIQKQQPGYDAGSGCKWPLRSLKLYLFSKFGPAKSDKLFYDIEQLCIRSLLAVQKVIIHDKHCFEMYGYDILIDDELKPWLIEVNSSPSLSADSQQDYDLKYDLLDDVLTIVDMERKLGGVVNGRVGGFDLIFHGAQGGHIAKDQNSFYGAKLGCDDSDRVSQLKKLHTDRASTSNGK